MDETGTTTDVNAARYTPDADDAINRAAVAAVRRERERRKLSQVGLAEHLGWPRSKVADLETGRARVLLADAIHLCIALDLDPAALLNGTPEARALRAQQAHRAALLFQAAAAAEGEDIDPLVVVNPAYTTHARAVAVNPSLIVADPAALAPLVDGPPDPPEPDPGAVERAAEMIERHTE